MFIDPCRNAPVLKRSLRGKPIKDDSIAVGALGKFSDNLAAVREFVHLDVDGTLNRYQVFAGIVEVVPRCAIVHASDQSGSLPRKVELPTIVWMFSWLKYPGSFILFWSAELPSNSSGHEHQRHGQHY